MTDRQTLRLFDLLTIIPFAVLYFSLYLVRVVTVGGRVVVAGRISLLFLVSVVFVVRVTVRISRRRDGG